jgi:hypothetical protein
LAFRDEGEEMLQLHPPIRFDDFLFVDEGRTIKVRNSNGFDGATSVKKKIQYFV